MKSFKRYFFSEILSTGFQRLLILGSVLVPVFVAYWMYKSTGREIERLPGEYGYYDTGAFYEGLIQGFLGYWVIYMTSVWVYRGFKDGKRPTET